jgi:hypothetical protein
MKLKVICLALVATAFMAGQALAQAGTMQPIPNPPEKAKAHHKKKAKPAAADATKADSTTPADAKPAMPAKKK